MSTDLDAARRRFLTAGVAVVGGAAVAGMAVPFVAAWQPSGRARAIGAPVEVDIGKLEPGQMFKFAQREPGGHRAKGKLEHLDQLYMIRPRVALTIPGRASP